MACCSYQISKTEQLVSTRISNREWADSTTQLPDRVLKKES
jgi:hypothetical protein